MDLYNSKLDLDFRKEIELKMKEIDNNDNFNNVYSVSSDAFKNLELSLKNNHNK